jgi:hypothetical protein
VTGRSKALAKLEFPLKKVKVLVGTGEGRIELMVYLDKNHTPVAPHSLGYLVFAPWELWMSGGSTGPVLEWVEIPDDSQS